MSGVREPSLRSIEEVARDVGRRGRDKTCECGDCVFLRAQADKLRTALSSLQAEAKFVGAARAYFAHLETADDRPQNPELFNMTRDLLEQDTSSAYRALTQREEAL